MTLVKNSKYITSKFNSFSAIVLSSLLVVTFSVMAYDFTLSEQEFNSWDVRCQALYLSTNVGKRSAFRNRLPVSIIQKERKKADAVKSGGWHYCAGLIYVKRAKLAVTNKALQQANYDKAIKEFNFTYSDISRSAPWFAEIGINYGNLLSELNQIKKAQQVFAEVEKYYPNYDRLYVTKAMMYWRLKKFNEGIKTIVARGDTQISKSMEMSYMLSFLYAESGEIESAEKYANIAYRLGYPLPGLKNKIEKLKESN